MAEHPNALRLRAGIDAQQRNDRQALQRLYAEDVIWHLAGSHHGAGDHRGREGLLRHFDMFQRRAGGIVMRDSQAILADDDHCVGFVRIRAGVGQRTLDVVEAQALRVDREGRFCEYWALPDDQAAVDEFLSS